MAFKALVSIITASYNCAAFLPKTVESVLSQTYSDWEMIIVDDCSNDKSVEIAKSFAEQDSRIKLIQLNENSGSAVARNKAIEAARGRYIAFLDSDDLWLPHKLEKQIAFMQDNGYAITYADYERINEQGESLGKIVKPPLKITYNDTLKKSHIGCLTAVYDTKQLGKVMMPLIRKRQDYGLWLKILKRVDFAYCCSGVLAQYRVRKGSISSNKVDLPKFHWHLYREEENLSFIKSLYYVSYYILNSFMDRLIYYAPLKKYPIKRRS